MQVSQQNDFITHAVIGGNDTIHFGISDSAEFFNILSSTLYKDQILAVTREVLCNAWDAHIEAGCMHIPVDITLTADKLTIKDVGHGIHRDDMGLIYGTYGNSTKKNDGTQTGGFGLGCKAPFAYTDHFEVISCHAGVKTIYNLSKSSAQVLGKPGIIPIASFPTTDTGLQVSIAIHNDSDCRRFETLVKRIAKNGDMHMRLNGELLDTLGFDTTKTNYLITREDRVLEYPPDIMVRYGNVVYPVDSVPALTPEYAVIQRHLQALRTNQGNYRIIFQAPPHSIAVTPSRESLSMQEHTTKTLKGLLTGFVTLLNTGFVVACDQFAQTKVQEAVAAARVDELLSIQTRLPLLPVRAPSDIPVHINDLGVMAQQILSNQYPKDLAFRKQDIQRRLTAMATQGLLDRGRVQTYLRALQQVTQLPHYQYERSTWLQRRIIAPLLVKLENAKLDPGRLCIVDPSDCNAVNSYTGTPSVLFARNACPSHLLTTLPYLRNIIVVGTSRTNLTERAYRHDVFNRLGKYTGFLFYHASMKKVEKAAALAFFTASGMEVVDLTMKQAADMLPASVKASVALPRKPSKPGAIALKQIKFGNRINTRFILEESAERILAPEFIVNISTSKKEDCSRLGRWNSVATGYIVDLFGTKGGITNNTALYDKWRKNGAKDLNDYLQEKICAVMQTSPAIHEFWAFNPTRAIESADLYYENSHDLITLLYNSPLLRKEFGLVNNLTADDHKYVQLWETLLENQRYGTVPDVIAQTKKQLESIPLDPINTALLKKFKNNLLLEIIDRWRLAQLLKEQTAASPLGKKAIQLLMLALNH